MSTLSSATRYSAGHLLAARTRRHRDDGQRQQWRRASTGNHGTSRRWAFQAGDGQQQRWQRHSVGSEGADDAGEQPPSSSSSAGGTSRFSRSPWELMGRVIKEERIALQFDQHLNQGLVRSAAARASGLEVEEFEVQLQRLFSLMPFLQQRMLRMQPKLLAALAADPDRVAARLIELKAMLPAADVAAVVGGRPSLLLEGEWEQVPKRVEQLAAHYTEEEVARLVAVEPLLLVEDIEEVLAELQRLLPQQQATAALLAQPSLAANVGRLRHLSLW